MFSSKTENLRFFVLSVSSRIFLDWKYKIAGTCFANENFENHFGDSLSYAILLMLKNMRACVCVQEAPVIQVCMRSLYLRFRLNTIEKWPYFGINPLIYSLLFSSLFLEFLSLAYNGGKLYVIVCVYTCVRPKKVQNTVHFIATTIAHSWSEYLFSNLYISKQ